MADREATAIELMPRAFPRRRVTYGWIDPINGWLVVDAGALPKAVANMGISSKSGVMRLFSSHPPIEERIEALRVGK